MTTRTAVASRTAVTSRMPLVPQSYNVQVFGDSLCDIGALGYAYTLGQNVPSFTSQPGTITELANGGHKLSQIATTFGNQFDATDPTYNAILLQGGHNDLNNDIAIATMKSDMAGMADAVIAGGNHTLIIINITPYGDNTNYNATRQATLEAYNTWLAATYPEYVVDGWSALNAGAADDKLATDYLKVAADSHPNNNGSRRVDQEIGTQLLYTRAETDLTQPVADVSADYRDLTAWTPMNASNSAAGTHGGTVLCADGTASSEKGLVAVLSTSITHGLKYNFPATDDQDNVRATFYLRAGYVNYARVLIQDGDLVLHGIYADLKNVVLQNQVDNSATIASWTIEKVAHGWVKVQGNLVNDDAGGGTVVQLQIFSSENGSAPTYTADTADTSAEVFVDAVSLEDLGP